jgi:hypothetical protein
MRLPAEKGVKWNGFEGASEEVNTGMSDSQLPSRKKEVIAHHAIVAFTAHCFGVMWNA